ncbi:MAG: hypothetical protein ACKOPS_20220, partial [Cyanobium sp.]
MPTTLPSTLTLPPELVLPLDLQIPLGGVLLATLRRLVSSRPRSSERGRQRRPTTSSPSQL